MATACGVSQRTLTRIKGEKRKVEETQTCFETPNKKRRIRKRVTGLDDFDIGVVRRIVNNFYLTDRCLPTIKRIRVKLRNEIGFSGSATSLGRILKNIGYRWRKTRSNKRVLMESQDGSYKQFVYLNKK